jgi:hypothetical protein
MTVDKNRKSSSVIQTGIERRDGRKQSRRELSFIGRTEKQPAKGDQSKHTHKQKLLANRKSHRTDTSTSPPFITRSKNLDITTA